MPLSPRLQAVVDAVLAATAGMPSPRVLEVGCGPGAAARALAVELGPRGGHVLATDRSATAVDQTGRHAAAEIAAGHLVVRQVAVEDLALVPGEEPYDLAFAVRVGALDGRHPELEARALAAIAAALTPTGRLLVDGGDPLREISLPAG